MWPWLLVYYLGAVLTLRRSMLWAIETCQRKRRSGAGERMFVPFIVVFWPVAAFFYLTWKLAFPRGVRTQYVRRRDVLALEQQAARSIRRAEEIVKTFAVQHVQLAPVPAGLDGDVLGRNEAEARFDEACEQVWRERGRPWSIGALANVRARHARAKVAANS